jgi:hypothetical protein
VRPKDVFINPTGNQVTVWADSETWFHDDVKDQDKDDNSIPAEQWLYHGEYIFIFDMDDSGTKITRVFEFLDSKGTDQLRALLKKARQNKAAASSRGASTSASKPTWQ